MFLKANIQDGTEILIPFLEVPFISRRVEPDLKQRDQSLGNVIFKFSISLEVDWHEVIVIDILNLPIRKPNIVAVSDQPVRHLHTKCNHTLEKMNVSRSPRFTSAQ